MSLSKVTLSRRLPWILPVCKEGAHVCVYVHTHTVCPLAGLICVCVFLKWHEWYCSRIIICHLDYLIQNLKISVWIYIEVHVQTEHPQSIELKCFKLEASWTLTWPCKWKSPPLISGDGHSHDEGAQNTVYSVSMSKEKYPPTPLNAISMLFHYKII